MDAHASPSEVRKPVCLIVLGMAGSGKTTFVNQLIRYLQSTDRSVYAINLDPAVRHVPFSPNVDIRDTVQYKEVMKQYGFGPNGAIMTSLNFFASQFHKVIELISKNSDKVSYVVLDTPGQIEVFTWSASGTIISDTLGSSFPTVVIYVMDTPRSHNPVTFMSNMLYACSVLYRMRLPFIVVLNKTDIIDCDFAIQWMRDFEVFQDALAAHRSQDGIPESASDEVVCQNSSPYMLGLVNSMSLVLDEFYNHLRCCGVSSVSGEGMENLVKEVESAKEEYYEIYVPLLESRRKNAGASTSSTTYEGHLCSSECGDQKSPSEQPSADAPPLGLDRLARPKKVKPMLVDLAGDCDEVEEDALVDLDGVEERPDSEEDDEDGEMDETFRQQCAISARTANRRDVD